MQRLLFEFSPFHNTKEKRPLFQYCLEQGAASVYSAVLVNKILDHEKPVTADFIGLEAENRYLFGYGMDYKGYLRNAAGIYACKEHDKETTS